MCAYKSILSQYIKYLVLFSMASNKGLGEPVQTCWSLCCTYPQSMNLSEGSDQNWICSHGCLTLYSMITPFDTFGILCILKYYGKSSICSFGGANAPFSIIFSKVSKTNLNFSYIFSILSKSGNRCLDLKITYAVKG